MDKHTCPYCQCEALKLVKCSGYAPYWEIQCAGCDATHTMYTSQKDAEEELKRIKIQRAEPRVMINTTGPYNPFPSDAR